MASGHGGLIKIMGHNQTQPITNQPLVRLHIYGCMATRAICLVWGEVGWGGGEAARLPGGAWPMGRRALPI